MKTDPNPNELLSRRLRSPDVERPQLGWLLVAGAVCVAIGYVIAAVL